MDSKDNSYAKLSSSHDDKSTFHRPYEDDDLPPENLSGDQNGEQSIFASAVSTHKANFFLTAITVSKTVIGSSILSIPFVVSQMGYVLVIIVFVVATILNLFGSALLLKAKNLSRHSNYTTIFYTIWPSLAAKGVGSVIIFLNNIGICIAELIVFKISIRKILTEFINDEDVLNGFYTQEWFIVLIVALTEIPPVLVSKMEKLKFMALAGVLGIIVFIVAFIIFFITAAIDSDPANNPVGGMRTFPDNWFLAAATVPNILLALSFQTNFFPIFKGMKNATDSKMIKAVFLGLLFCLLCYLLVGILGYDYVGNGIKSNMLENLQVDKIGAPSFIIIYLSFLASLFFAFPIMFFGGRNNFIALIKLALTDGKTNPKIKTAPAADEVEEISSYISPEKNIQQRRKRARIYFLLYTSILYAVTVGAGMGLNDIQVVFNAVGAICATSTALLLPAYFYIRLINLKSQKRRVQYYLAWALLLVMTPYALFSIIALYVGE